MFSCAHEACGEWLFFPGKRQFSRIAMCADRVFAFRATRAIEHSSAHRK